MLLSSLKPKANSCIHCDKDLTKAKIVTAQFECGHQICKSCYEHKKTQLSDKNLKCPVDDSPLSASKLIDDIEFLEYVDSYSIEKLDCELHSQPVEYFSRSDKRFVCIKCLSQFLDKNKSPDDLIQVSPMMINKDLYKLRKRILAMISDLDTFLHMHRQDSNYLSKFFQMSLDFINKMTKESFDIQLDLFKKNAVVPMFHSSIVTSKTQFANVPFSRNIIDLSKILTQPVQENFIKSLFDKKIEIALIHRASDNEFEAEAFHRDCDDKAPTLCIFKSEKEKIFGGYSDKTWSSKITFKHSKDSFLFSLDHQKRLKSFRNFERALFLSANNGASFGEDLIIGDKCNEPKSCRSLLGRTYEPCEGYYESYEAQKSLAGKPNFALIDYEVYLIKFVD